MKELTNNLVISKILYAVIVVANLFLPLYSNSIINLNVCQILIIFIWLYGILCHHGYFKHQVSKNEDGKIKYEWNIPIVPIGFTRIAQVAYYIIRKVEFSIPMFAILVILDVVYIAFLAMDNYSYYYESESEVDE